MADAETIKERLNRASETVSMRPKVGQRVYRNTAVVGDGLLCHVTEKDHSLMVDVPKSMGGENTGPTPSTILRTALTSCVAIGIKMWAARRGVPIDRIEVSAETDVDARGQLGVCDAVTPGFEGIRMLIVMDSQAPQADLEEIVAVSLKYSPLIEVLDKPQPIETTLVVRETIEKRS